eukprot:GFKZ01011652.1.p1 GENE.GFKZ01011652.1~~GFKZ01011652.1.p1  ORF type:complete len:217 (-),score=29.99 GFKZ01011652.1:358-1008(-)
MQAVRRLRHTLQGVGRTGVQHRGMHATWARYGVMDSMRKAYDTALTGNEEKRQQKVFAIQMKHLKSEERMNGDKFLEFLDEIKNASGLGGVREHLPWVSNNPALGELKEQEKIMRAFEGKERRDIFGIGIGSMKRVARELELDRAAVEAVVMQVRNLVVVQKWVRRKVENGQSLPASGVEMQSMLRRERVGPKQRAGGQRMNPGIKGGTSAKQKLY